MASITLQLIFYRFEEFSNNMKLWYERALIKYYNLRIENVNVLDLYVFVWIIATLVFIIVIKIVTKCIQFKVLQISRFWICFAAHYFSQLVQKMYLKERLKFIFEIFEFKIKSSNCNDDAIKWILSSFTFPNKLREMFLQSLNKEAQRILVKSSLMLNFLNMKMISKHLLIKRPVISIQEGGSLVICFTFELRDLYFEVKASNMDWEKMYQLHVKHIIGGARLELLRLELLSPGMESIDAVFSTRHLNDFVIEHSVDLNETVNNIPHNMDEIMCKILVNSKIRFNLSELMSTHKECSRPDSSPIDKPSDVHATATSDNSSKDSFIGKLLVRLIKIESLSLPASVRSASLQVYCRTTMDQPLQQHLTTSIMNTTSPYFDETFLFSIGPSSKHLTIEVLCSSGGIHSLVATCARTMDELKHSPYRKFLALNGFSGIPSCHTIGDSIAFDNVLNTAPDKNNLSTNASPKVIPHHYYNNGIRDAGEALIMSQTTPVKKSSGTLCAEFLFMDNEISNLSFSNHLQPDLSFSSNLEASSLPNKSSFSAQQSKSSTNICRDLLDPLLKVGPGEGFLKNTSSEVLKNSNTSMHSGRTLIHDEAVDDNYLQVNSTACGNGHKKKWSLLTSIRRRWGDGVSRSHSREDGNRSRSKSAESSGNESSPAARKNIFYHYQCTPLRRNRRAPERPKKESEQLSLKSDISRVKDGTLPTSDNPQLHSTNHDRVQHFGTGLRRIFSGTRFISPSRNCNNSTDINNKCSNNIFNK